MNEVIIIVIGIVTLIVAFVTEIYARKTYQDLKSPKIVVEYHFPNMLIRNVASDIAKNITEKNGKLNTVPVELWNFCGPIDNLSLGVGNTSSIVSFSVPPEPKEIIVLHFDYTNTDGSKFFSEIEIERTDKKDYVSYKQPRLMKWK